MYEAWYSVRQNVLEELDNSIPSRNEDLIRAKECATNTDFIGRIHSGMLLFFHWNAFRYAVVFYWNLFNIHIQILSDYTLIWFIEIKWHEHSFTCMVNHSSLMYKM